MSLFRARRRLLTVVLAVPALILAGRRVRAEAVWQCQTSECGFVYNPAGGDPDHGIAPGTAFEDLPESWTCPNCGSPKSAYALR
jgi:rubredoxin